MARIYLRHRTWWLEIYRGPGKSRLRRPISHSEAEARSVVASINAATRGSSARQMPDVIQAIAEELREHSATLESLVKDFLDSRAADVKPSSLYWYRLYCDRFVAAMKHHPYQTLSAGQIARWLASQRSPDNAKRALKAFGRHADAEGTWKDNPLMRLRISRPEPRKAFLSAAQIKRALRAVRGTKLLGPFLAGLLAGLRAGEICHARLDSVDRRARTLTLSRVGDWTTKSNRARVVPLHPDLVATIERGASGWAWTRDDGAQWDRHELFKRMKAATGHGLHILRHTFVTRLLASGAPVSVVRDLAGHSSIAVTDGYAHTDVRDLRQAINRL
jgi:integrase